MNALWKKNMFSVLGSILVCLVVTACEKVSTDDLEPKTSDEEEVGGYHVTFHVKSFEQTAFDDQTMVSRAANVSEVCTRINFGVFTEDNTQIKKVNQQVGDKDFGLIDLQLAEGKYHIVALAHNCNGNATYTDPQKITFPDNKVTDTFYYYGEVTVSKDEAIDMQLHRAVSMFRLVVNESIPTPVNQLKLYYTGGSSTFNAVTGYGCVNSKQTEYRQVVSHDIGQQFEVYTFLHADAGQLKMTVTAQDANGEVLKETNFSEVPMKRNCITQYSGSFFSNIGDTSYASSYMLHINSQWEDTSTYTY